MNKSFLVIISLLVLGLGCEKKMQEPTVTRTYPIMGTIAEIKLYGEAKAANLAADQVQDEFLAVQAACNIFDQNSEISRLNKSAGETTFKCSPLLWEVLLASKKYYELSDGAFDISAKPLMSLWGFYRKRQKLPSVEEIARAQKHVGLEKVHFDLGNQSIKFLDPELSLDLGGIAKGFAVDRAYQAALDCGIRSGTINLGGNVRCLPEPPPNRDAYIIGVRHPRDKNGLCGTVSINNMAFATSGDYEKYVAIEGKRFTHIMDPKSGHPVSGMLAVTVIAPLGVDTDGLSTSIFIQGESLARKVRAANPRTQILIIRENSGSQTEMIKIGDAWENCWR